MNMKKLTSVVSVIAVLTMGATGMCFAATEVPARLTIPVAGTTSVDINVGYEDPTTGEVSTNGILMVRAVDSPEMTVQDLTIRNNSGLGKLIVERVEAVGIEDLDDEQWSIVSDSTDFANLPLDSHKLSLVADGTHDMTEAYEPNLEVEAAGKASISFTGKTGPASVSYISEPVAQLVLTVSLL